jgi:glycosyltransferase involved in cell wall biosynthesis
MILGIDASNIRAGGGVTHLINILTSIGTDTRKYDFSRVIVWGGKDTLEKLPEREWLDLRTINKLNNSRFQRVLWLFFGLSAKARAANCDVLLIPGGLYFGNFRPYIAICQTLLPFEYNEVARYGFSARTLRLIALRFGQSKTFSNSNANIFLSHYAEELVSKIKGVKNIPRKIIHHGAKVSFMGKIKKQNIESDKIQLLYVSTIDLYKHQWNVIAAVAKLRKEGINAHLTLIGGSYKKALDKINSIITIVDPEREFIKYEGIVDYREVFSYYVQADIFVFASTCENLPVILLEAMSEELPIACSNKRPMLDILKDGGLYFDSESISSITRCLRYLIDNPDLQKILAARANKYSQLYSWDICVVETLSLIKTIYENKLYE